MISSKEGAFEADISGGLLSVRRDYHPVFTCRMNTQPWFVVHSDGLYAQNASDSLTPLYRGNDAPQLLACLNRVLRADAGRRTGYRLLGAGAIAVILMAAGWLFLNASTTHSPSDIQHVLTAPALQRSAPQVIASTPRAVATPLPAEAVKSPAVSPSDGWAAGAETRAAIPGKLKNAAARGLFTIPLSSGHQRTLYVFADPECANCRRMERHFEAIAGMVNVVIFPVTTEGGQTSLDVLTPVMALPEADRAQAWKTLFSADAGIPVPGKNTAPGVTDEERAEVARAAIGVNEVAFRAYRLPGTPWTISDDGRYVPQAVLSSPAALQAFLNGNGGSDD